MRTPKFPSIAVIRKHAIIEVINALTGHVTITDTINTTNDDTEFHSTMDWVGIHRF